MTEEAVVIAKEEVTDMSLSSSELLTRLELIRKLKAEMEDLQGQIRFLEDEVKAEMEASGRDTLRVGDYEARYKMYTSQRFDSNLFRREHEDLYASYMRPVNSSRFSVTRKD